MDRSTEVMLHGSWGGHLGDGLQDQFSNHPALALGISGATVCGLGSE